MFYPKREDGWNYATAKDTDYLFEDYVDRQNDYNAWHNDYNSYSKNKEDYGSSKESELIYYLWLGIDIKFCIRL